MSGLTEAERKYLGLRELAADVIGNGGALWRAEADELWRLREMLPECHQCGDRIIRGRCESADERWHA